MKKGELIVVNKKEISIKNMGYILKQARLKMGYTRDQLSERVGISHRYLTAIENEERRPSYEVLSKLLRNLGLSADSIFYPEKESEPEETPAQEDPGEKTYTPASVTDGRKTIAAAVSAVQRTGSQGY